MPTSFRYRCSGKQTDPRLPEILAYYFRRPTQAFNVYGHDPVGVGIRGLPVAFGVLGGAVIVLFLLSVLRGHNKELMIVSSILMTAGCGSLACANRDNINTIWALLFIAGLGIGGIVVPASM